MKSKLKWTAWRCSFSVRQTSVHARDRISSTRPWQPRIALKRCTLRCWVWCSTRRAPSVPSFLPFSRLQALVMETTTQEHHIFITRLHGILYVVNFNYMQRSHS